ncbi:MAG: DUF2029 domain-containing protein, partial [Ktedonobacterales bacterium]|nr:DUF2029 domain-containing protein [Ktedonobacterales bacterium]
MDGSVALAPRLVTLWRRALVTLGRWDAQPQAANMLLLGSWGLTRLALVLGMVLGRHFADPWFYHYAGQFTVGQWPYRDIPVEYPPLAMVLLLLPALPLLPFSSVAPRPDAAFTLPLTHLPHPDAMRYSAYGLSFAVEMLLIDVLTLWLVRVAARRFMPRDSQGLWAGLLYIVVIFFNGALLQKFDLAAGALCLAAVLALVSKRPRLAWGALAAAALVKGFPVLLIPLFALYLAAMRRQKGKALVPRAVGRELARGMAWCGGVLVAVTVPIIVFAGWERVAGTVLYHTGRGTEIESLYATVMLALGWLPGLRVTTAFNGDDLSRVVRSPLDPYVGVVGYGVLALLLVVVYAACWRAYAREVPGPSLTGEAKAAALARPLAVGAIAVLLAFMLAFRALPAHYLLVVIPLAALIHFPKRRTRWLWRGCLMGAALAGQAMTVIWSALVDLRPWAVALLAVRNLLWLWLFAIAVVALWRGSPALVSVAPVSVAPVSVAGGPVAGRARVSRRERLLRRWRRLIVSAPPIPGFSPREEDVAVHLLSRVAPGVLVLGAGVCSALIYLAFVLAFPITALWNHPHVGSNVKLINDMGQITGYSPFAAFGFVGAVLVLFLCQFLALVGAGRVSKLQRRATSDDRLAHYGALLFPLVFILIMIWMQPVTTTDLYGYVARGYLFVFKHANPMTTPATLLPGGLLVDRPAAPYGPAWLLVAALVSRVAGQNLLANMLAFKVIEGIATVAALLLIDHLARELYPQRRVRILVLFGWSPVLIFEAIGNGHNDIVMMVLVLAAFVLMLHRRSRSAFACFVLGALIKYVAAVLLPLWLVYELRRRTRIVAVSAHAVPGGEAAPEGGATGDGGEMTPPGSIGGMVLGQARALAQTLLEVDRRAAFALLASVTVIGAALVAAFYAPFWDGPHTFTGLGQQLRPLYYNSSIVAFLTAPLQLIVPVSRFTALDKTVRLVFYILFGAYVLIQINRLWHLGPAATLREVITAAAKILFAALLLITFWFQPWYVVWLLPLAALSQEPYVRRQGTILGAGALMTYAVSNFLLVNEPGLGRALFVQFFEILVTFGPLLLLRAAPYEGGWVSIAKRYLGSFGAGLRQHPVFWERLMLVLVLIVAALLRLLRLGNLFAPITDKSPYGDALSQISGDLGIFLSDPQGLRGPFLLSRALLVRTFGPTPFAVLLPSAVVGTLTVLVIYLLTKEIMQQGRIAGKYGVALLAALLAATSRWHVSLSRSGVEVILLPLLVCTALYWLLLAFRLGAPVGVVEGRPADVGRALPLGAA